MSIRMLIRSILIGTAFIGLHALTTLAADPANPYAARFWGECTWYAAERRPDLRFNTGYAYEWADASRAHGFVVDTTPEVGAIAVWGKGVDGAADCCGHVAYVIAVSDANHFRVAEYNWGAYHAYGERDVTLVAGIQFIHPRSAAPPPPPPDVAYTYGFEPMTPMVGTRVKITAGVIDRAGHRAVNAIDVFADGSPIGTINGASGTLVWDTSGVAAGAHAIRFRARLADWSGDVNTRSVNLVLQAAPVASVSSSGGPDPWDTSWLPSDRRRVIAAIEAIITSPETGGSPNAGLKGYGEAILNYSLASIEGNPAGVNPAFALAMFRKEANFATYGAAPGNKNPGNIICAGGTRPLYGATGCNGRFGVYASMDAGIRAYFWLLQAEYKPGGAISRNCSDIPCIIRAYAPASENNTNLYIAQVTEWTRDFQNRISNGAPVPPPPPPPARPDKPTLSSPANGARLPHNADVTLTWNAVANATQYKVELWGGSYSTMTPCDWQSSTTCHIGTMWPGTMQWHVKARNASRQESDWSDTWSFTIEGTSTPTWTHIPTPTWTHTSVPTWTRTPTLAPTPTYTPAPPPPVPSARDLQVIGTLTLSTTSPQVGQSVTAVFKFRNVSNRVVTIERLVVGARGPGARTAPNDGWGAREVDFPARTNLVLRPGEEYEYRDSRSFDQPGDYFAEPAYLDPALGKWEGIPPYPRVWFNVMPRTITTVAPPPPPPPSPGRLVLVEGLRISNTNPQVNQSVNARFRVRNDGGQAITARFLGVKGRHSSGASYDFHWIENLTLQPGQEYTYDVNRSFDRTGSYVLTPNWFDGANWRDLTFANGSTSYVTINVASPPPPPTFTPAPPSPGRVVLTQGLTISPSNPTRGQNVNARFVAKNIGGSPVTFRFFGVKGRHSSGAVYDFHWLENFTLQPGQEFTYDVNRTFDRTGSFTFTPNYSLNGSTWADLTFANGSKSYVTISVR